MGSHLGLYMGSNLGLNIGSNLGLNIGSHLDSYFASYLDLLWLIFRLIPRCTQQKTFIPHSHYYNTKNNEIKVIMFHIIQTMIVEFI